MIKCVATIEALRSYQKNSSAWCQSIYSASNNIYFALLSITDRGYFPYALFRFKSDLSCDLSFLSASSLFWPHGNYTPFNILTSRNFTHPLIYLRHMPIWTNYGPPLSHSCVHILSIFQWPLSQHHHRHHHMVHHPMQRWYILLSTSM